MPCLPINHNAGDGGRAVKVTDIYSGAVIRATRGGGAELVTVYFEDSGVSCSISFLFPFCCGRTPG